MKINGFEYVNIQKSYLNKVFENVFGNYWVPITYNTTDVFLETGKILQIYEATSS